MAVSLPKAKGIIKHSGTHSSKSNTATQGEAKSKHFSLEHENSGENSKMPPALPRQISPNPPKQQGHEMSRVSTSSPRSLPNGCLSSSCLPWMPLTPEPL